MTHPPLRIALSQMNSVVGDITGNEAKILEGITAARDAGAQLVVFPELALTGYPPEDLLLKEHFLAETADALERIADEVTGIVAIVGYPERTEDVHNSAAVLADGAIEANYRKLHLPNYGVFDELRYFQPGERGATIAIDGVTVGLTICEDIWQPGPPLSDEALSGARVIVNLSASPFAAGKGARREQMIQQRARDELVAVAF
ncbi:MAG TPA: nitrilase-related carbon-nitrogen hydrolase, partial [Solirubrobacteraceae bacterium]|nr:nitrilase-related carbon-nitrogen hydrolase [Solirubrobacteraceae bacterium]